MWQAGGHAANGPAGAPVSNGQASATAQSVAAHRLWFDRASAPYGHPRADERLCADVAGEHAGAGTSERMISYLAARTRFVDRAVVTALDRGIRQVVIAGAGYDGRAWRYAKPGVAFIELDHPATQADKQARLARLGINTDHVRFVAAAFARDPIGPGLTGACLDVGQPSLIVCEGVAAYLQTPVLTALLAGLADVVAAGSRLVITVSVSIGSAGLAERRAAFQDRVAALGEPAGAVVTAETAEPLLIASGWHPVPIPQHSESAQRAQRSGFLTAERVR
jgi:methyltransferase (TIGR00027 family)